MNNYQYIKDALKEKNKSLSWLADEIGVSKGYLSRLLNNKINEPGTTKIKAIHQVLNLEDNNDIYEKTAYLIDVKSISIEKYIYVALNNASSVSDIYIFVEDKNKVKDIVNSLNRFYDYLNFSSTKISIVALTQLKKDIVKEGYTKLYAFNNEFDKYEIDNIINIPIKEKDYLKIKTLKNNSILFLSNNQSMLSVLLNVLKLTTNYAIDDFAIFKDVNTQSNAFVNNQMHILEQISKQRQNNRIYMVGNELLYLYDNPSITQVKNGLINYHTYLDLFDMIICIDFENEPRSSKSQHTKNNKLLKSYKKKSISITSDLNLNKLADEIKSYIKEYTDEN